MNMRYHKVNILRHWLLSKTSLLATHQTSLRSAVIGSVRRIEVGLRRTWLHPGRSKSLCRAKPNSLKWLEHQIKSGIVRILLKRLRTDHFNGSLAQWDLWVNCVWKILLIRLREFVYLVRVSQLLGKVRMLGHGWVAAGMVSIRIGD